MSDVKTGDVLKNKHWMVAFHIEGSFDVIRRICGTVPVCLRTPTETGESTNCCTGHVSMHGGTDDEPIVLLSDRDLEKAAIVADQTKTNRMKN